MPTPKIRTFLWYNDRAEEAANFYCSLFPNSRVVKVTPYPEGGPGPAGSAMTVEFELAGLPLVALNGGPHFQLTEAVSLSVDCADQAEVDFLWDKLTAEGKPSRCGWLTDKYGLSWQIVPEALPRLMGSKEPGVAQRVMAAMMQMVKLDVATLERAAAS